MGTEQSTDIWALVITNGAKYIGAIRDGHEKTAEELHDAIAMGYRITMFPVYEVAVNLVPRQTREGVQISREVGSMPVVMTVNGAPLHVYDVVAMQLFSEMKEADASGYKRLAHDAEQLSLAVSAQRAGLLIGGNGA